jgi:hypothetical protein
MKDASSQLRSATRRAKSDVGRFHNTGRFGSAAKSTERPSGNGSTIDAPIALET